MDRPDISRVLLALTSLLTTFLTLRCLTPPNPAPISKATDRAVPFASANLMLSRRLFVGFLGLYHALIMLNPTTPPARLCLNPSHLNLSLFTWTPHSVACLGFLLLATPVRLLAFKQLGESFTFALAMPRGLVTDGLYRYAQHPSYTVSVVASLLNMWMFERPDGVFGCWLNRGVVQSTWWSVVGCVAVALFGWMVAVRVVDEEKMLKESFGREWEEWHGKTKRFMPGLF